ncbi:hypothetical protein GCM10009557_51760 [Virgisporangium ochraceum]|uniref:EVE domain-containing protein n=1 Tax=Virgisporangium ochraceum TaxID=65505 RepID=A0A8J3ZZJ9_9ACTN|nr:hypothetical protein [Virgisporangium ochraceum]GIJ73159.1 hypothetical protein Voc01_080760 [Virgisporangium ochraceum]
MTARVSLDDLGAWLLKANGDHSDVAERAARRDDVARWCVQRSYRTALMAPGQPVLLWVSGSRRVTPGVWAVGTLTGRVSTGDGRRQHVPVALRWLEEPVPRDALRTDPRLGDLEVLRQPMAANPSVATRAEYEAIRAHLSPSP